MLQSAAPFLKGNDLHAGVDSLGSHSGIVPQCGHQRGRVPVSFRASFLGAKIRGLGLMGGTASVVSGAEWHALQSRARHREGRVVFLNRPMRSPDRSVAVYVFPIYQSHQDLIGMF